MLIPADKKPAAVINPIAAADFLIFGLQRPGRRDNIRVIYAPHMIYSLPRFVPGFRLVPLKIAASGARALLAMTNLVGLAEKRGSFQNEMFENRYETTPRKNDRIQQNASVFQTKTLQFCVIARPLCGRGNLKAKGMASRDEAR